MTGIHNRTILAALLVAAKMANADAAVDVSLAAPVSITRTELVNAASFAAVPIGQFAPDKDISVSMNFRGGTGDLAAFVVDEASLNFLRQGVQFHAVGVNRHLSPIAFEAKTWSFGNYFLVLDARHSIFAGRQVNFSVRYTADGSPDGERALKETFEKVYSELKKIFVFKDFDIHVRSCGTVNAFSSPDITLCSELLSQLVAERREDAVAAVLFHELGHSLLNVWGMPGYDNEDVADEFMAIMLLMGNKGGNGSRALSDVAVWFSEQNSKAQAENMLLRGDRHALSVQRVRNLQRIAQDPSALMERWNHVLYEHMTEATLQQIKRHPGSHDDPSLAGQVLATRARSLKVTSWL